MKIDTTQALKDYEGKNIPQGKGNMTLRDVISTSINSMTQDKPMSAEDKNKAYQISTKIWASKAVDLTVEQLAFIKGKVGEVYNPLVFGRVSDIFDGEKK